MGYPGHYVPTLNGKAKNELGRRWPGLDIKGDGGYAVALGRNKNGRYKWLGGIDPDAPELAPMEIWDFLRRYLTRPAISGNGYASQIPAELLIEKALDHVPSGGRNDAGFWLACQLRDNGYCIADACDIMSEFRRRCPRTNAKGDSEQYTNEECQASLEQAYSRAPRDPWKLPADGPVADAPVSDATEAPTAEEPSGHIHAKKASEFLVTAKSVFHIDKDGTELFVCSHLRIDARTRDANGSEWAAS